MPRHAYNKSTIIGLGGFFILWYCMQQCVYCTIPLLLFNPVRLFNFTAQTAFIESAGEVDLQLGSDFCLGIYCDSIHSQSVRGAPLVFYPSKDSEGHIPCLRRDGAL